MRLTILAGLITGAALGMQATLSAHMKPKRIPAHRAIRVRVIAPWYMASNDATGVRGGWKNEAADSVAETRAVRSS